MLKFKSGKINQIDKGDYCQIGIGSETIEEILDNFLRHKVNVILAFNDRWPISPYDLLEMNIEFATGEVENWSLARYSDLTGFLYLNEESSVGGHDLLRIFQNNQGNYGCILISHKKIDLNDFIEDFDEQGETVIEHNMEIR